MIMNEILSLIFSKWGMCFIIFAMIGFGIFAMDHDLTPPYLWWRKKNRH